jgi:hypothetical protein
MINFARWFSYTRLLERELVRERRARQSDHSQFDQERLAWQQERHRLENAAFASHGVTPPHRHLIEPSNRNSSKQPIPRAVGPFDLAARNAALDQRQLEQIDKTVRAPVLPDDAQDRIREAAEKVGLTDQSAVA